MERARYHSGALTGVGIGLFQLFLLANVLFFAIQSLTGIDVLGSRLESELHQQDWSGFAQVQVARRVAEAGSSVEAYRPIFDRAVVVNAKSLIILMALPFAAGCALAFLGDRKPLIAYVAFSRCPWRHARAQGHPPDRMRRCAGPRLPLRHFHDHPLRHDLTGRPPARR